MGVAAWSLLVLGCRSCSDWVGEDKRIGGYKDGRMEETRRGWVYMWVW